MKKLVKALMTILVATQITGATAANAAWKQDSNGWWNTKGNGYSIGWGHHSKDVYKGMKISQIQANKYFDEDKHVPILYLVLNLDTLKDNGLIDVKLLMLEKPLEIEKTKYKK